MKLASLIGLRDVDLLNGKSLPEWLNERDGKRQTATVEQQTNAFIADLVAEQKVQNEADRVAMLGKAYARLDALDSDPNNPRRRHLIDKWTEAAILLEKKNR